MRYRRGTSRHQQSFLSIDDQISQKNIIRLVDRICENYVGQIVETEFDKGHKETGRKPYHPADLLKVLVYGYFNGLSSSRKLERECGRNIEIKWLTGNLVPDHKTISDFRRDNPEMINGLFRYLINKFREEGLVTGKSTAVDGSKIKAYADRTIDITTVTRKLENIDEQVRKYLQEMEKLDNSEDELEELSKRKAELEKELDELMAKKKAYETSREQLEGAGENRISPTDPEARLMRGRYGKFWGYNIQCAVDTRHHFITNIQATNQQNDKGLLQPMAKASEQITAQQPEEILADAGYYKMSELETLESNGTTCYVAINWAPQQENDRINGIKFDYSQDEDRYYCSEGKALDYWRIKTINGRVSKVYKGKECAVCKIKEKCTTAQNRTVMRHENQEWLDNYHAKMESQQGIDKLIERKSTVEHPFGTMKYNMGQIPILLRGKKQVQNEMNLYAIGYNLKRYFNVIREQKEKQAPENMSQAA